MAGSGGDACSDPDWDKPDLSRGSEAGASTRRRFLHMSRLCVSRQVSALERDLKVRCSIATARLVLTPAGRLLHRRPPTCHNCTRPRRALRHDVEACPRAAHHGALRFVTMGCAAALSSTPLSVDQTIYPQRRQSLGMRAAASPWTREPPHRIASAVHRSQAACVVRVNQYCAARAPKTSTSWPAQHRSYSASRPAPTAITWTRPPAATARGRRAGFRANTSCHCAVPFAPHRHRHDSRLITDYVGRPRAGARLSR